MIQRLRPYLLVLLVAVPALFWQLGARALTEPDEGRCASIAAEMQASGDWLLPRLYGLTHVNKPPLLYWILSMAFHFGGLQETAARAVPASAAMGCVLLTVAIGRRLGEPSQGIAPGLLLVTSPLFAGMARVCDYNMLLAVWVTMAYWAALAWRQDGKPWQRATFYLACVLAMLTKGPVGPAIVALGLLGERLLGPRGQRGTSVWHLPSFMVAAAAGLAWFIAVADRYPTLWDFFLHGEMYDRVFTKSHHRSEPLLFYFFVLPVAVLPWLPAVTLSMLNALRTYRSNPATRFALGWIALPLLMFTLAGSKMPTYVLPLLPALCLVTGQTLAVHQRNPRFALVELLWITLVLAILIGLVTFFGPSWDNWSNPFLPRDVLWLVAMAAAAAWAMRRQGSSRMLGLAAMATLAYLTLNGLLARRDDALGPHTSVKFAARAIAAQEPFPDRVVLLGRYPRGLSFYLKAPLYLHRDKFSIEVPEDEQALGPFLYKEAVDVYRWWNTPERIAVITSPRALHDLRGHIRKPVRLIYDDGHYLVAVNY